MTIRTVTRRGIFVALTVAALATAGSTVLATPASADPHTTSPNSTVHSDPPAVPGVPDVGQPGEGTRRQTEPTIDPHGNPVWPTDRDVTPRDGWTAVIAVVDGARIRTQPVTGVILGLIPVDDWFYVSCKQKASDGTVWGYATHARRYGWVRSDLWAIIRSTAPHSPPAREIPWC